MSAPTSSDSYGQDQPPSDALIPPSQGVNGELRLLHEQANILIVDDRRTDLLLMAEMVLTLGHRAFLAEDGEQAMIQARRHPPDLILLDLNMPVMDGRRTLERLKDHPVYKGIPVVVVSGVDNTEEIARCLQAGADDYITKPYNPALLKARIEACLAKKRLSDLEARRYRELEAAHNQLQLLIKQQFGKTYSAQLATIFALSKLVESRDRETGKHLERIREYCQAIARQLAAHSRYAQNINELFIDNLYNASPLHDIGKVAIPDSILCKPGQLTEPEREIIKMHTVIGARTLREVDLLYPGNALLEFGTMIAESHHERWDGNGYPHGSSEDNIPLAARILSVGDVYDALTANRCYRPISYTHEEAVEMIRNGSGTQFDPVIVEAFLNIRSQINRIHQTLADDPDPPSIRSV
ncbi:response regulator receiver modulated metal dependent phosphohydrolase [Isosphaera pallida ATCC 43644]|uniref:Response regulator receiver modulated metal dependent phosphohydrolase n=1 Tax=Isosphaera pallida (strain ATCC 43644 / DSM 9630 / IS1B) TaxID=575540 RepID=E8QZK6_ISOPI|nr:HD domain-containing phosphohydrolase [Isosphaera pallida]ADV62142.1 response regulator receiver modulated metal dependent phosphohydrolase [Isosphaera pallida ATCC 43644]